MRKTLILALLLFFLISYSEASRKNTIQGLRYSTYKSYTRVVVDISGPVEYSQNHISKPARIFFDLKDCSLSDKVKFSVPIKDGIIESVRIAQYDKDTVRVVLDIAKSKKYYAFMLEDPNRLVIDVYSSNEGLSSNNKKKGHDSPVTINKNLNEIRTVVIDAGHGGKDPGAVGPRGVSEKGITLYVAKKLGKILRDRYAMKIIYTRQKDVFIPLNRRTHIANSNNADLFISIHTNASKKRNVRGIETYFLNWTNKRENMRVAARENRISIKKMKKVQDGLQFILQDLARKNKNEESMRLAHSVQNSMVNSLKKNYSKIENLGVKYALFYVLVGAEMPSVLAEISFISNYEEEKRLSRDSYKNKIAEAIANGIKAYISQSTLIVKPDTNVIPRG